MQIQALWDYFKFRIRGLPKPDASMFDFLKPGMLVFDVGANLGNYSQLFLDKKTKVIAVEPQSYCKDFLRLRFRGNPSIKILGIGLGAMEEKKELRVSSAHTLSSFNSEWIKGVNESERFKPSNAVWEKKEIIRMQTLDQLILQFGTPDYLKIDVEGYEKEVLKGLSRRINYISFEYTIPELTDDAIACIHILKKTGDYEFLSILENENSVTWLDESEIEKQVLQLKKNGHLHNGDIFARLKKTE